jgi:hypothetical protein
MLVYLNNNQWYILTVTSGIFLTITSGISRLRRYFLKNDSIITQVNR